MNVDKMRHQLARTGYRRPLTDYEQWLRRILSLDSMPTIDVGASLARKFGLELVEGPPPPTVFCDEPGCCR